MAKLREKNQGVFIDRDGTLIYEKNYLSRIKDVRFFSGAVNGLKKLRKAGFRLVLVTNQSGIARGYLTEKKLLMIHAFIRGYLRRKGAAFDAMYYCKHHPEDKCGCRKPKTGMVDAARRKFNIDPRKSYVMGDHANDMLLARNMKGRGVFMLTGHGPEEANKLKALGIKPDKTAKNFSSAVSWIIKDNLKFNI